MEKLENFIKKNWVVILVVAIIVAIIYCARKKKAESSFIITGCNSGALPNPITGICDNSYSWDQLPTGMYRGENSYRASTARTGPSASGRIKCGPGCKPFLGICWCVLPQEGAPPPVIKM